MAYGNKYRINFNWDHDDSQSDYRLFIREEGFGGAVTTLTATETPCIVNVRGQRDRIDEKIVYGSELEFNFIVDKADVSTYDTDFLESAYKDFVVHLIEDPSGSYNYKWVGYLRPENASREFYGNKYIYKMSATDGLADLKNFYYSSTGYDSPGSPYNGFEDLLTIIKTCLGKLYTASSMQRPFRVQLGTYSDLMSSTENALKENEVVQELFWSNDNNYEYNNCYDVIDKVLSPFHCTLKQSDGYWWIQNTQERDSYYFEYDWATLTQQSRTASNLIVYITDYDLIGRGQLYKIAPPNRYNVTLYNKDYDTELVVNGNFDSNITGWTNGDADNSSNSFSSFAWYDYPGVGGTAGGSYSGAGAAAKYNFHSTAAITFAYGAGAGSVAVRIEVELNSETRSGGASAIPLVQIRLWNATDGYIAGSVGQGPILSVGGFYSFTETFDMTAVSVAGSYLDFEVETQDATTTAFQCYFDDVTVTQINADTPLDWKYYSSKATGEAIYAKEKTVYISEKQESTSDICALKDTGGSYPVTWTRYGETEDEKLLVLLQQEYFNENYGYKDYLRLTIYDPNENVQLHKILAFSGDYYFIIGMIKNYREGTVEVDLVQTKNADISINTYQGKLTTQYGKEI